MPLRIPLRVVFYRDEDGDWIAHCLEFDLCGHGDSHESALDMLADAISIQVVESIEANNPDNLFNPADKLFFTMFAAGSDCVAGQIEIHAEKVEFPNVSAREFAGDKGNLLEFA